MNRLSSNANFRSILLCHKILFHLCLSSSTAHGSISLRHNCSDYGKSDDIFNLNLH